MADAPRFYIFHGEDDLAIDAQLEKMRQAMGDEGDMNTSEFSGESASVPEIVNAVTSLPFLAEKRLVIVRGLITHITRRGAGETGKKAVAALLGALAQLPDFSRLVLLERETLEQDKNSFMKGLAKAQIPHGYVKVFSVPKDMSRWLVMRAQAEYDVAIDPQAAAALAEVIGDDLRRADNELLKLVSYVDGARTITEADVAALTPYVPEADIFKMVDAVAEGRGEYALKLMYRLLADERDKDSGAIRLFSMIVRQFRNLIVLKEGGTLRLPSFVLQNLRRQAKAFSMEELEAIYQRLHETDVQIKTGAVRAPLALDLLVSQLAVKR